MSSTDSAHASEPSPNIFEFVNLDLDIEASRHSDGVLPETSCADDFLQAMGFDHSPTDFANATDTDFTRPLQLSDGRNASADGMITNASQKTSEGRGDQTVGGDSRTGNVSKSSIGTNVPLDELSAGYLDLGNMSMADAFQTTTEQGSSTWAPPHLKHHQEPSRWAPASPQLQQHLNIVYAPQLAQYLADPYLAPVLYFPAQEPSMSSNPPLTSDFHPRPSFLQMPHPIAETPSIDPSLLMHKIAAPLDQKSRPNLKLGPIPLVTDHETSNAEDAALPTPEKRALAVDEFDSEPAPKRIRNPQGQPLTTIWKDNRSEAVSQDDADHESCDSNSLGRYSAPPSPIRSFTPVTQKGASTHSSGNPTAKKSPYWRYEQDREVRLRVERRKERDYRRANRPNAEGKAHNRKMQKILEEIEDTEGYAEAQGYKVEDNVKSDKGQYFGRRRPVRKGARKNYVGQE